MRLTVQLFLLLAFACYTSSIHAQVQGCKDPAATNYNAAATITNGSCIYNLTKYSLPVKVKPLAASLSETSGLQWAGGNLWTFNDGGGHAALYRIDTLTQSIWQTVLLEGATNVDWEDIAFDGTHFYIGDIGNYTGSRTDLKIYKFPIAAIQDHATQLQVTVPANVIEIIHFTYADQPQPIIPTAPNNTAFDCEAMIVDQGAIHLFTKDWVNKTTTHYRINSIRAGTYSAQPIETLSVNYLITGADKPSDKAVLVLIGYNNEGLAPHYMHVLSDFSSGRYFNGNKRKVDLPDVTVIGQTEGITFRNETYGYICSERFIHSSGGFTFTVEPMLHAFELSPYIPLYLFPIKLTSFNAHEQQDINQISWQFNKTIPLLTVEHSTDSTNFVDLINLAQTISGSTTHTPQKETNYYRLRWPDDSGHLNYSQIISAHTVLSLEISHFVLRSNGALKFTVTSNTFAMYGFQLTTMDGKLLGQQQLKEYGSGGYTISLHPLLSKGSILLLTVYTATSSKTYPLQVQ